MYLGLNKRGNLLVLFLIFAIPAFSQPQRNHRYTLGSGMNESRVSASDNSITIDYCIPELDAESFTDNNGNWFRLSIPGHIPVSDIGKPEVPVLSKLIVIPEGHTYNIRISGVKSSRIRPSAKRIRGELFPVQEGETKDMQREKPQFRIDKEVYAQRKLINADTVKIEPVGIARGKNLATLSISPVRYNPRSKTIEVITAMKIEIIFTSDNTAGQKLQLFTRQGNLAVNRYRHAIFG